MQNLPSGSGTNTASNSRAGAAEVVRPVVASEFTPTSRFPPDRAPTHSLHVALTGKLCRQNLFGGFDECFKVDGVESVGT